MPVQVIALLSTCGSYFSKGAAGRRLDRFLTFMQAYVAAKQQLPLDVEADLQVRRLQFDQCDCSSWFEQFDWAAKDIGSPQT
jgi:hypothetical protein